MKNLSHNLKKLRKDANLTQDTLSKSLNISRQTLSYYECGSREPDLDTLINISNFFNCSIDYLLKGNINQNIVNQSKSILDIQPFSSTYLLDDLKQKKIDFEKSIVYINNLISLIEKECVINQASYNTKKELEPVVSLDEYKSKKHSIDVDFYKSKNINIINSHFNSIFINDNLVKIPFFRNINKLNTDYDFVENCFAISKNDIEYDASNYVILQINRDSMSKLYKDGDFVLVLKTKTINHDNPCIFIIEDNDTFKLFELSDDSSHLICCSTKNCNTKIISLNDLKNIKIFGMIVGVLNFID